MESRIQRSFFDLKQIMRSSFDVLYERIAVQELSLQHSENHNLQGTRKEVSPYRLFMRTPSSPYLADLLALGLEQNGIRAAAVKSNNTGVWAESKDVVGTEFDISGESSATLTLGLYPGGP